MKVLLDECVPRKLKREMAEHKVRPDPDVAAAFSDAKAVNDALRLLLEEKQRPHPR